MKAQQSAVRLTEIGPRMTLQLIKVEEGLSQGNVLYHSFILKTEEQLQVALARREERLRLKAERRCRQEADVQRKEAQREAHSRAWQGSRGSSSSRGRMVTAVLRILGCRRTRTRPDQSDDDVEYYRQEVGEEPDQDLFPKSAKRKHGPQRSPQPSKRLRTSQAGGQPASPQPGRASRKVKHRRLPGQQQRGERSPREPGISQRPGQQKDPRSPKAHRRQEGARSLKPKGPTQQGTKRGLRVPGSKFKGPGKPGLQRKQAARGKGVLQRPRAPKKGWH
ncbi:unnamed protein product [Lepidochelys kempii]